MSSSSTRNKEVDSERKEHEEESEWLQESVSNERQVQKDNRSLSFSRPYIPVVVVFSLFIGSLTLFFTFTHLFSKHPSPSSSSSSLQDLLHLLVRHQHQRQHQQVFGIKTLLSLRILSEERKLLDLKRASYHLHLPLPRKLKKQLWQHLLSCSLLFLLRRRQTRY